MPTGHGNALAIDAVLVTRPSEWGISAPGGNADFKAEASVRGGAPTDTGVFSHKGTEHFKLAASGKQPCVYIKHGVTVIQTAP